VYKYLNVIISQGGHGETAIPLTMASLKDIQALAHYVAALPTDNYSVGRAGKFFDGPVEIGEPGGGRLESFRQAEVRLNNIGGPPSAAAIRPHRR
jgi:hypothetical protein